MSRATYLDLIEADRANDDEHAAAAARRRATLSLGERRPKTRKAHAMKRTPRYRSGPKKGQFKPRHARAAAPRRRKTSKRRHKHTHHEAMAAAPRRRRRRSKSGSRRPRSAPRRSRGARRRSGNTTIVVARETPMATRRRRRGHRRGILREAMRGSPAAIALLGGGIVIGLEFGSLLNRMIVTIPADGKLPEGVDSSVDSIEKYNALATMARPSWLSVGLQIGIGIAGIAGGAFLPWNWAKALSFGIGLGVAGHAIAQLATAYIVAPLFKKSEKYGRYFTDENNANQLLYPPKDSKGGQMGDPPTRREQPALPVSQPERYPHAFASQMGAPPASMATPAALRAAMDGLAASTPPVSVDRPQAPPPQASPPIYTAPQAPSSPPVDRPPAQSPPPSMQTPGNCPPSRFGDPPMESKTHPMLSRRITVNRLPNQRAA